MAKALDLTSTVQTEKFLELLAFGIKIVKT